MSSLSKSSKFFSSHSGHSGFRVRSTLKHSLGCLVTVATTLLFSSSLLAVDPPGPSPSATPPAAAATPTPTPTPSPTATPAPPPSPSPSATPKPKPKPTASWSEDHKKQCESFYRGKIQAGVRRACILGGTFTDTYFDKDPKIAETACRLQYGEEPGETFACLIGTRVAREIANKSKQYQTAIQLCSEVYPVRTELDGYLLESCLIGVYAPTLTGKVPQFDLCTKITHERSFWGPCTVGVSLAFESKIFTDATAPSTQNVAAGSLASTAPSHRALCEKYFDQLRFHLGYRSCLNARAVKSSLLERAQTLDDVRKRCDEIVSDPSNDHERGACLVGAALMDSSQSGKAAAIFDGCGVNQVRFEDRDFLGCLAAGSILFFRDMKMSLSSAPDKICRQVFRDKKSQALSGCVNSLASLSSKQKESTPHD